MINTNLIHTTQNTKSNYSKGLKKSSLDIKTELVGTPENKGIHKHVETKKTKEGRKKIYLLKNRGKRILTTEESIKKLLEPEARFRHQSCGYISKSEFVKIGKTSSEKYQYNGVRSCALGWRCPTCSLKIQKSRADEIYQIRIKHELSGKRVGSVTLTTWHQKQHRLKYSLNNINRKYRNFQNLQFFKRIRAKYMIGQIKALEITYTYKNGWHPHLHIIYYFNLTDEGKIKTILKELTKKWADYTEGSINAQDYQVPDKKDLKVEKYITKWDVEQELTNDFHKSGKGIKPFQMLEMINNKTLLEGETNLKQSEIKLVTLFAEYAQATKRKHRLNVSQSLNTLYEVEIKDDEELVTKKEELDEVIQFTRQIWITIYKNTIQPDIIDLCYQYNGNKPLQQAKIFELIQEFAFSELSEVNGTVTISEISNNLN